MGDAFKSIPRIRSVKTRPLFESQNLRPEMEMNPTPENEQDPLSEEVQQNLLHEYEELPDRPDITIANHLIRGFNRNTELTIKVKHGVEHLHQKDKLREMADKIRDERLVGLETRNQSLEDRNETIDEYMKTISDASTWLKEKVGWWLLQLIKLAFLGLAYLIVDFAFVHLFHTKLPGVSTP